jgi:hypothetical protein
MPYPTTAIQTPFTATASPTVASGHALRKAASAFATRMLDPHHELGVRGMRPARAAGQRWESARDCSVAVSIESAEVICPRGTGAGRPVENKGAPGARDERGDCRGEQEGYSRGLPLVPGVDRARGILPTIGG